MNHWILIILTAFASVGYGQSPFVEREMALLEASYLFNENLEEDSLIQVAREFQTLFIDVLNLKGSYDFPFDSLSLLSKLEDEKGVIRLFSWQVKMNEDSYLHFGIVQSKDRPTQPIVLNDISEDLNVSEVMELQQGDWLGCYYYNMISFEGPQKKDYYLLMGFDSQDRLTNKKIIDILYFDDSGMPFFGAPVLKHDDGMRYRRIMEYDATASTRVNFDRDLDKIVLSHLIPGGNNSLRADDLAGEMEVYILNKAGEVEIVEIGGTENEKPSMRQLMQPDGSYEGYELKDGIWEHINKVFGQVSETAPRPKPIFLDSPKAN